MGRTKHSSFTARQNRLAALAKALGHPARVAILELLARRNSCVCGAIVDEIPLSQATVSQHLAALKRVGLIIGEIDGPKMCYCLDRDAWNDAQALLLEFLPPKFSAKTKVFQVADITSGGNPHASQRRTQTARKRQVRSDR